MALSDLSKPTLSNDLLDPYADEAGGSKVPTHAIGSIFLNNTSYSGADIKVYLHVYSPSNSSLLSYQLQQDNLKQTEENIRAVELELFEADNQKLVGPDSPGKERANAKANALARKYERMTRDVQELSKKVNKQKIQLATGDVKELGELQTLSISTNRDKRDVRALGHVGPKGRTRGPRCLPATEKVYVKERGYISIADVDKDDLIQSSPNTFDKVINSWYQGRKQCYNLCLENGYTLNASFDHPVFANNMWIQMKDLRVGDKVFVSTSTPVEDKDFNITDNLLQMIGLLLGDGSIHIYPKKNQSCEHRISLSHTISLSIANKEIETIGDFVDKFCKNNDIEYKDYRYKETKCIERRICVCKKGFSKTDWRQRKYNELHKILLKYDLYGTYSHTKFIPQDFLAFLSKKQIVTFLRHLFATDGGYSVSKDQKYIEFKYCSVSEELIDGIRLLLSKLNIKCLKGTRPKEKIISNTLNIQARHDCFVLVISNAADLVMFFNTVGIFGKDDILRPHIPLLTSRIRDRYLSVDPIVFFKEVLKTIKTNKLNRLYFKLKHGLYDYRHKITPRKALLIAKDVGNVEFSEYVNNLIDLLFKDISDLSCEYKVCKIREIGLLPVYDLEVENRHSFVCNFIKVHNSISGTMIFTVFNKHVFDEVMQMHPTEFDGVKYTTALPDQMAPIDVTIVFANEYGHLSRMAIYGIDFATEGMVMSIQDILTECTLSFYAYDIDPMRSVAQRRIDDNYLLSNDWTGKSASDLMFEEDAQNEKNILNPFFRFAARQNPFV